MDFNKNNTLGIIRRAKALLFSLRYKIEAIVTIVAFLRIIDYNIYFCQSIPNILANRDPIDYVFPEWYMYYQEYTKHFSDGGFIYLLCLTSLSYNWRFGKWSLALLWFTWILGLCLLMSMFTIDFYYIGFVELIFAIFVYNFVKHALINR